MEDLLITTNQGRVRTFDLSRCKFAFWWKKFRAFAYLYGFGEVVQGTRDPNLPNSYFSRIDTSANEGLRQFLAKKANYLAISSFTMAFTKKGTWI
jgi:hypothetical protein